jgi:hypothetical protein
MFLLSFFFIIDILLLLAKQQQQKSVNLYTISVCYAWALVNTELLIWKKTTPDVSGRNLDA